MNEKQIKLYKTIYKHSTVSDSQVTNRWEEFKRQLPAQEKVTHHRVYQQVLLLLVIILAAILGTVSFAQAAKPGEMLYPVKVMSAKIVKKASDVTSSVIEDQKKIPTVTSILPSVTPTKSVEKQPEKESEEQEIKEVEGASDKKINAATGESIQNERNHEDIVHESDHAIQKSANANSHKESENSESNDKKPDTEHSNKPTETPQSDHGKSGK